MSEEDEEKIAHIHELIQDGTLRFTEPGVTERERELNKSMSRHPAGKKRRKNEENN
ncbi:hypothetical protein HWC66_gp63 [Gordonia phage Chikenjars]|uniref:Uncharacterized protein n=1 Tax=Gordonia phage Chikenjars TaxID=2601686 RepID=A0A5J6D9Y6_9CAUD|nr:hypothetical protein HWC66_gp63 [Gordonia phage Chikenjars]QEQ94366.1 hypothetical protein SEA_CHIKENJARS_63 [Gordonia phage Chikenjars]